MKIFLTLLLICLSVQIYAKETKNLKVAALLLKSGIKQVGNQGEPNWDAQGNNAMPDHVVALTDNHNELLDTTGKISNALFQGEHKDLVQEHSPERDNQDEQVEEKKSKKHKKKNNQKKKHHKKKNHLRFQKKSKQLGNWSEPTWDEQCNEPMDAHDVALTANHNELLDATGNISRLLHEGQHNVENQSDQVEAQKSSLKKKAKKALSKLSRNAKRTLRRIRRNRRNKRHHENRALRFNKQIGNWSRATWDQHGNSEHESLEQEQVANHNELMQSDKVLATELQAGRHRDDGAHLHDDEKVQESPLEVQVDNLSQSQGPLAIKQKRKAKAVLKNVKAAVEKALNKVSKKAESKVAKKAEKKVSKKAEKKSFQKS